MSTRYTVLGTLASGGMGTVFLARMAGSAGFSRLVAIKRLNPELAAEKEFIAMLVDEARLASSLHHANIVNTLDLVATDGAFSLVLEYIEGAALSVLTREAGNSDEEISLPIMIAIIQGVLRGLDAAHEARSVEGTPLGIVHRDISPQNVLVGTDGVPRIIDFGIAKAMGRMVQTRPGEVRGKFAYMAPEQLLERPATRQADVYATGVVLWELLTGHRLFNGEDARVVCAAVLRGQIKPPSSLNPAIPKALDEVVLRATALETSERYLTARELLNDLAPFERASDDEVGRWVRAHSAVLLAKRAELLQNAHQADGSRSVEDLVAELQMSATPSDGVPIVKASRISSPDRTPPTQKPVLPSSPEHTSTVALPLSPSQAHAISLAPAPETPPSERGLTSAGVVMSNGLPTGTTRLGPLVAIAAALAVLVIGGGFIVRRNDTVKTPPDLFGAMPPLPTPAASPGSAEPPSGATSAEAPDDPGPELVAAPTATTSSAPSRPTKRRKPGTTKKPAAPNTSPAHDFEYQ